MTHPVSIPPRSSDAGPESGTAPTIKERIEDAQESTYSAVRALHGSDLRSALRLVSNAKDELQDAEDALRLELGLKREVLNCNESAVMRATFRATMLRASEIISKITQDDVTEMQMRLLGSGMKLPEVAHMDRLHVAVAHLRTCARNGSERGK